jgi:flagellar hook-associated protein 1 FlgK
MSLLTTLHAARRGITVASEGINIVGHNTANATTDGYSRREMTVTTMYPLYCNGAWLGQGPNRASFTRSADSFVDQNMISTAGSQQYSKETFDVLKLVESKLSDATPGSIIESYREFTESMRNLSNEPDDPNLRDLVVLYANRFTNSINEVAEFATDIKDSLKTDMETSMNHVNDKLATIANLNARILGTGGSISAGDLQDQRDLVIRELAEITGVTVRFSPDGQANVYMDGHVVVQNENHRELEYYEDASGDPQIAVKTDAGRITVTEVMQGRFGGRNDAYAKINTMLDSLNNWATQFVSDFNTVHQGGYDQNGNTGLDFFTINSISPASSITIDAGILADSSTIAVAGALNATTGFPDAGDRDVLDLLIALEDSASYGSTGAYTARQELTNIYSSIATKVREAQDNYDLQSMRMEDINELRASISGVNLDEEAVKLMEYQASYEAASRVISVTNMLLGQLMDVV